MTFGINIDNLLDIACNKFSALFDRHEAKDFVDVYFLCQEFMPFDELFAHTQKKHVGLDEYWMARALENVSLVEKLPRMLKPLDLPTLRQFFEEQLARLMKRIEGNS
ncbi:MAG: nucleotidyl transferase AbiEii/AbiGii toxin family protein [candidate division KSB1 bacterium]|nr:nucleotidyl transferase AbiEii/AbiGii toxin family protein [candidate division KSB1 bacterium]MDZ7367552.1 nucleotidyl transferase AbiEii/AbiGii toxin family protein [candidate division KSB1 bacterium]MDZ7404891.1 nucleotidyl transferase AbiEii/AbiGii toxin family protein [candidate division KSB1 bacterium]